MSDIYMTIEFAHNLLSKHDTSERKKRGTMIIMLGQLVPVEIALDRLGHNGHST